MPREAHLPDQGPLSDGIPSLKAELLEAIQQEHNAVRRQLLDIQQDLHRILLRLPDEVDTRRLSSTSISMSEAATPTSEKFQEHQQEDQPTFGCGTTAAGNEDQNPAKLADPHFCLTDLVRKLRQASKDDTARVEPPSPSDLTKRGVLLPPLHRPQRPKSAESPRRRSSAPPEKPGEGVVWRPLEKEPMEMRRSRTEASCPASDREHIGSGSRRFSLPQPLDEIVVEKARPRNNSMPDLAGCVKSDESDSESERSPTRTMLSATRDFYYPASERSSESMSVMSKEGRPNLRAQSAGTVQLFHREGPAPLPGVVARYRSEQNTESTSSQNQKHMNLPACIKTALLATKDSAAGEPATEFAETFDLRRMEPLVPGGRGSSPSRMSTISGLGSQDVTALGSERMTAASSSDMLVSGPSFPTSRMSTPSGKKDTHLERKTSGDLVLSSRSTRRTLSPSRSKEKAGGRFGRRLESRSYSSEPGLRGGSPSNEDRRERQAESGWASVVSEPGIRVLGCRVRSTTPTMTSLESAHSNTSSKLKSCEALRQEHEQELMKQVEEGQGMSFFDIPEESPMDNNSVRLSVEPPSWWQEEPGKIFADIIPRACGMLPWTMHCPKSSWLYQQFVTLAAAGVLVASSLTLRDEISEGGSMVALVTLDVLFALGCVVGLIACGVLRSSKALTSAEKAINAYAYSNNLSLPWGKQSSMDVGVSLLIWVGLAVGRVLFTYSDTRSGFVLEVAMFNFSALLNMGMVCYVLHICRGLIVIVDTFCHKIVDNPDFAAAVRDWNRLQAVCRGACAAVQNCFVVLLMLAGLAALIVLLKVSYDQTLEVRLIPGLLLAFAIFRISVWAAAVTDKCMHVPLLVNSLTAGGDLNADRMYAVQYILQSQAGFYVFEMRLTCSTMMKAFYIGCAVTIGIATQLNPTM